MIKELCKRNWLRKAAVLTCNIPWENPYDSADDVERVMMERRTRLPTSSVNAFVPCLLNHLVNILKASNSSGLTQSCHYVSVKASTVEISYL